MKKIVLVLVPNRNNPEEMQFSDIIILIKNITNILLLVAGGVALLFIIIGGIQYMTSYGDEEKAKGAKSTILWAVVGLVIVALAWGIVQFVGSQFSNSSIFQPPPAP
ncbi:MAG: hypothetical protein COX39_01160 [Candidatus Nealsonbacteria bacterium CG23_combo_of_CG06-09_8_20_14_all_40_13]|uniref:Uncharacterized protein n=1 Tax=Candidatus Nealsonbacteria bacterium CG23_combo_of_CG06-09_8_20_14_all_40_13 TaxID=1974724 RepID=A0A2G9YTF2_9BACT|nr:MAG: hypothetical protein COX39_01160 [Candidatus Nealsonbacteria bacterium CG23_combo_of_CG06-09_8_20_14_all_40_13]PIR70786.1 MAG: hypothetical protein COU44_03075 [Candidatus Nealsonbacteria bacterium CG10_big_fil_rev_8_21_14_0_10_40_24]